MNLIIRPPYEKLSELDNNILILVCKLLIDIGKWLIDNGPHYGKNPSGIDCWADGYEDDANFKDLYYGLLTAIKITEDNITIDNIENLYITIHEYEYNYWIDSYYLCRVHHAFKAICKDAYNMMYGGEMDEETTYLIDECDWEELDAIVYTYIEYIKQKHIKPQKTEKANNINKIKPMSIEIAKKWYKQGGDFKETALKFYSDKDLSSNIKNNSPVQVDD